MVKKTKEPELSEREIAYKALEVGLNAVEEYLEKEHGLEPSYFAFRFTIWALSVDDFQPLWKIEFDTREGYIK